LSPTPAGAARHWAEAAFLVAREHRDVKAWLGGLERMELVLTDEEVATAFANPRLDDGQRVALALALLGQDLNQQQANFLKLLVLARRTDLIAEIRAEFQRLVDEAEGRIELQVTTPFELSTADQGEITRKLSEKAGRDVKVDVHVDPQILGGLIIRQGDHVVDGSVRRRLVEMREQLLAG
jgi:F-type H+-transporting ATPase subunit delta